MSEANRSAIEVWELPAELPLLPIRDLVVFPFMVVPLFVSRKVSMAAVDEVGPERLLFLSAQKAAAVEEPGAADVYGVGTVGKILRVKKRADGQLEILVQGLERAAVKRAVRERPGIVVEAELLRDERRGETAVGETEGLVRAIKDSLETLATLGTGPPQEVMSVILGLADPSALADLVAANLGLDMARAQTVLEARSALDRLRRVNELLAKELEVVAWQQKIQTQAKEQMSKTQREYFLRTQLQQIRNELGDRDHAHAEVEDLKRRLAEARLSEEASLEAGTPL